MTSSLEHWFASGRIVDVALVVIALEAVAVLFVLRGQRGLTPLDLLGTLAAGGFLLLAVRSAVAGAPWFLTVTLLTASFPAHVFDLWRRFRINPEGER